MKSRNERSLGLRRYLPQTTIEKEDTATGSQKRRHKKENGIRIVFFAKKQSGREAAATEKNNAQTRQADQPQIFPKKKRSHLIFSTRRLPHLAPGSPLSETSTNPRLGKALLPSIQSRRTKRPALFGSQKRTDGCQLFAIIPAPKKEIVR
jgi:hypothetical protein